MLRIENLSKTYANGVQALKGVTLDIPRGMFGLLGPNGAGKSTLMRTLATLQDVDAGSLHFENIDVLREKHEVRKILEPHLSDKLQMESTMLDAARTAVALAGGTPS